MIQLTSDCMEKIFENLEYEDIHSCLLVNRTLCKYSVPILWRTIWNYNTLIASLPNESKNILNKNEINFINPNSIPPLFNYTEFIKSLSIDEIDKKIERLLKHHKSPNINYNKYIVTREIFKMCMNKIYSLRELSFPHLVRYIPFTTYPGATECLRYLSELSCSSNIYSEFFYQLSQICHKIQSLNITFNNVISNGLIQLITVQKNLKYLTFEGFDNLEVVIPLLKKHSNNFLELNLYGHLPIPLSFIADYVNLRELVLSFDRHCGFENFENLQDVSLPRLQILKFSYGGSNQDYLIKFLERNGMNLEEFTVDGTNHDSLNLAVAKFCPNLRSLFTIFLKDEIETLKIIFNNCQQLECIRVWCGGKYLPEDVLLKVVTSHSPKYFYELKMNYECKGNRLFINWKYQNKEQEKNKIFSHLEQQDEHERLNVWLNQEWWIRKRNDRLSLLKNRTENERSIGRSRNEIERSDELIIGQSIERLNERLKERSVGWTGRSIGPIRRNEWLNVRRSSELPGRSINIERRNELNERLIGWTDRSMGQNTNELSNEPTFRDENDKAKEGLESFFISWTNRVPKKSFSLTFISQSCSITTKLEVKKSIVEVIEKYKELGVVKKFEVVDFYDFEL
ncbi:11370_t:CDS:1 [Funneliformis geosporum]|uniref:11370_t:CDS:1 n=1 Tax=Funneliformis geosporum TaxID=1117311 RepID=A0A9W4WLU2_9GLOM|nr:11370_t:CDS:1 [Funneliformis geosporum]